MKIGNRAALVRVTKRITIPKPEAQGGDLSMTVQALPIGFDEQVLEWLPRPQPRRSYAMKGNKVLHDERGQPVLEVKNTDPEYLARLRRVINLQGVALVYEGLQADSEVTWKSGKPPEDKSKREEFYSAILEELVTSNLTPGDLQFLINEISGLSVNKAEDFEKARESFSSEDQH